MFQLILPISENVEVWVYFETNFQWRQHENNRQETVPRAAKPAVRQQSKVFVQISLEGFWAIFCLSQQRKLCLKRKKSLLFVCSGRSGHSSSCRRGTGCRWHLLVWLIACWSARHSSPCCPASWTGTGTLGPSVGCARRGGPGASCGLLPSGPGSLLAPHWPPLAPAPALYGRAACSWLC